MRFRFLTFNLGCSIAKSSNPTTHIPSLALKSHTQQSHEFDDNIIKLVTPKLFSEIQKHETTQTPYILNKIVSFCANSGLFFIGIQLHSPIIKMGLDSNVYITTALIDMYGKCSVVSAAVKVFDKMPVRNVVSWNTLMSVYMHNQNPNFAIELFSGMVKRSMSLTPISISTVLVACAQLEAVNLGAQIHGFCVKTGFCFNVVVGTGLIDMYGKCSDIDYARRVFDDMLEKNVVTWTSMVTGYSQNQQPCEAMVLVREMLRWGLKPTYVTYTTLLSSLYYPDDLGYCKQIHSHIVREGLESNSYLGATLVTVYSDCNCRIEDFYKLCTAIKIWDQVTWSAVIAGFSNLENGDDALACFSKMREAGVNVDFFTFTSILRATGIISALEIGKQIHALVLKSGYAPNVYVQNGLISMYARCGEIGDSGKVFSKMDRRDLISWNSLLTGLAHHGYGKEAVEMFEQMRRTKIKPDLTTFLAVLSACSHVGLLDKGLEYFDLMKRDYTLKPNLEHYTCVVDLYGRAALLNEAEAFIRSMPIMPAPSVLKALISACQVHGNTYIAVRSAKKLAELYPNDPGTYVLLSNVLANGGYWDNAAVIRKLMCDRGLRKDQASSWIR